MAEASWVREPGEGDGTLEENWLFRLRRERFRSRRSGKPHDYYVLHLADAVNVVALTPDRNLVLVRQFRAGSGKDSLETPGGLLEPGEDPRAAGARELLEETGFAGDPPVLLGSVWSNPSIMTSRSVTILIANARRAADPTPDHGEEVLVELVPERAIPRMIRDGRIDHALTVAGLLWWLVSDLPGSPLAPVEPTKAPRQFRIAHLLALVAACAVACAIWSRLDLLSGLSLAGMLAFPAAAAFVTLFLDPPARSILLRPTGRTPRRAVLRLMAVLGMSALIVLGLVAFTRH